jgi:sulfur carrier protein ThiS
MKITLRQNEKEIQTKMAQTQTTVIIIMKFEEVGVIAEINNQIITTEIEV